MVTGTGRGAGQSKSGVTTISICNPQYSLGFYGEVYVKDHCKVWGKEMAVNEAVLILVLYSGS